MHHKLYEFRAREVELAGRRARIACVGYRPEKLLVMFRDKFGFVEGLRLIADVNTQKGTDIRMLTAGTVRLSLFSNLSELFYLGPFMTDAILAYPWANSSIPERIVDPNTRITVVSGTFTRQQEGLVIKGIRFQDLQLDGDAWLVLADPSRTVLLPKVPRTSGFVTIEPETGVPIGHGGWGYPGPSGFFVGSTSVYVGPVIRSLSKLSHGAGLSQVVKTTRKGPLGLVAEIAPEDVEKL